MDIKDKTLISVIMPVYNRVNYICGAVHSILQQDYEKIELIIIDDGSSISIQDFVELNCPSPKIRYLKKDHGGLSSALNEGIKNAYGHYIAFLDDDDLWHPEMISSCFTAMAEGNADIVAAGYKYFRTPENPSSDQTLECCLIKHNIQLQDFIDQNYFPVNTVMVKRGIILEAGLFDETMKTCMDWDLWLRIIAKNIRVATIQKCLAYIRVHEANMSRDVLAMLKGRLRVLEKSRDYLTEEQQQAFRLKKKIAYRMLLVGWYLLLNKSSKKALTSFVNAARTDAVYALPALLLSIVSLLPVRLIRYITKYLVLFSEIIMKKKECLYWQI